MSKLAMQLKKLVSMNEWREGKALKNKQSACNNASVVVMEWWCMQFVPCQCFHGFLELAHSASLKKKRETRQTEECAFFAIAASCQTVFCLSAMRPQFRTSYFFATTNISLHYRCANTGLIIHWPRAHWKQQKAHIIFEQCAQQTYEYHDANGHC